MRLNDSTEMSLPILFLFAMVGLLAGVGAMFFLIENGKHASSLYVGIGWIIVAINYVLIMFTGFFYVRSMIKRIRDEEKIKELQDDLNQIKKGEKK